MIGYCERCGNYGRLREIEYLDAYSEKQKKNICDDCDWELMNGRGDINDDSWEIQEDRWEEEYEYDPVNTPSPYNDKQNFRC